MESLAHCGNVVWDFVGEGEEGKLKYLGIHSETLKSEVVGLGLIWSASY